MKIAQKLMILMVASFTLVATANAQGYGQQPYGQPQAYGKQATQNSNAGLIELSGQYAGAVGNQGQNFDSSFGLGAAYYFDPILDPAIPNFFSVAYNSFTLKADPNSGFKVFPILAGIEFRGKVFEDLNSTFALAAGGAFAYISSPGSGANLNPTGYFVIQTKPGLQWFPDSAFGLVMRTPITLLIGRKAMTYVAGELGVQFKL